MQGRFSSSACSKRLDPASPLTEDCAPGTGPLTASACPRLGRCAGERTSNKGISDAWIDTQGDARSRRRRDSEPRRAGCRDGGAAVVGSQARVGLHDRPGRLDAEGRLGLLERQRQDDRRGQRSSGLLTEQGEPPVDAGRRACADLGRRARHLAARSRRKVPAVRHQAFADHGAWPRRQASRHRDVQRPRSRRRDGDDPCRHFADRLPRLGPLGDRRLVHRSVLVREPDGVRELLRPCGPQGHEPVHRARRQRG